jgi:hypothetical protein
VLRACCFVGLLSSPAEDLGFDCLH